jgi:hypothetical protein
VVEVDENAQQATIEIYNAIGQQIYKTGIHSIITNFDLNLPVGLYRIRLSNANRSFVQTFQVQ